MELDEKYLKIIQLLQQDAKLTSSEISQRLGIPITTVHNRIKKLEREGIIKGYTAVLDHAKLGKGLLAHILVRISTTLRNGKKITQDQIAQEIKKAGADEVSTVLVMDEAGIIIRMRARDIYELQDFITKKLRPIDGVERTHTLVVLNTI